MRRHRASKAAFVLGRELVAQGDEVGPADRDVLLSGLLGRHEVGVVGQRRVARHAEVGLHPALGRQPVVVPPHRVEDLPAPHAAVAGDGVGLHVAEDRAHVQRARHRRRGGVDGEDLVPGGAVVEAVGVVVVPGGGPVLLETVEGGLVGDAWRAGRGGRHDRVTVPGCCTSTTPPRARSAPSSSARQGEVSMYVCGPTVYDLPHIGHGRLQPDLRHPAALPAASSGLDVRYVSNITDVDDNIIRRAAEQGRTEPDVATEFEARWWEAMDALGVPATRRHPRTPRGYIEDMVALVADLMATGRGLRDAPTASTSRSTRSTATGCWPGRASTRCGPAPGWRATRRSARRSTSPCGRRRRRASPAWDVAVGRRAGRAGTPSAW